MVDDEPLLPFVTRLWFAWLCLFRVLFDGRYAAQARKLLDSPVPAASKQSSAGLPIPVASAGAKAATAATTATSALQLLSLLQREGRFVDFLQQDITAFADADVGVAARLVHAGCRRTIREHAEIEPVIRGDEGTRVELAAGFDADEVKLVGNVGGSPPYSGVVRHRGWRAIRFELPQIVGAHDARVLAPAQVELA